MTNTTLESLKKENRELKELLEKLLKNNESKNSSDIPPNKQVRVTSVYNGMLNLKEYDNQSVKYKFDKIGDSKTIPYSSLSNIVSWKPSLAYNGYYYIEDKDVVSSLELGDYYENMLSFKDMESICEFSDEKLDKILPKISDAQKKSILYVLLDDLHNKKVSDLNKVRKIGDLIGIDIMGKYNGEYEKYYNN